jgi:hypothetical protein
MLKRLENSILELLERHQAVLEENRALREAVELKDLEIKGLREKIEKLDVEKTRIREKVESLLSRIESVMPGS